MNRTKLLLAASSFVLGFGVVALADVEVAPVPLEGVKIEVTSVPVDHGRVA